MGTIVDDDAAPVFSIASASAAEGSAITFTVTRTGRRAGFAVGQLCDVALCGNTASADDFTGASGTLIFAAGVTSLSFTVSTTEDVLFEGNETLTVALSEPTGGAVTRRRRFGDGHLLLVDDDAAPEVSPLRAPRRRRGARSRSR